MFKPHIGNCVCHNKQRMIVVKKGYCKEGNEFLKRTKKNLPEILFPNNSTIKRKKPLKLYKRRPTGELALFKEIWNEREQSSEVSGLPIAKFHIWCFSHILPKGLYPAFRLKKENIIIKTPREHWEWTNRRYKLKKIVMWEPVFELEQKLKEEYNAIGIEARYHVSPKAW